MEVADGGPLSLTLSLAQPATSLPVLAMATATTDNPLPPPPPKNPNPIPLPVRAMDTATAMEPATEHRISPSQPQDRNLPTPDAATATGYRFPAHPHALDLIQTYLRPRVLSNKHADFIAEINPYSATPDQLAKAYPPTMAGDGPAWYYFTTLREKKGGRINRSVVAGSGWSWHQDRYARPIKSGQTKIGQVLTLSYSRLKEGSGPGSSKGRDRTGWLMAEYSLELPGQELSMIVLCKVYHLNNENKGCSPPARHISIPSHPVSTAPPPRQFASLAPGVSTEHPPLHNTNVLYHPPDGELILKFLLPVLTCNLVVHHQADIYQVSPSDMAKSFSPTTSSDGTPIWYFLTHSSTDRMVAGGVGCWEAVHASADVHHGSNNVGQKRLFRFCKFEESENVYDGWHMVELSSSSNEGGTSAVVLCKVYRTISGAKRTNVESPALRGCYGTKKAAVGVTVGPAIVM